MKQIIVTSGNLKRGSNFHTKFETFGKSDSNIFETLKLLGKQDHLILL